MFIVDLLLFLFNKNNRKTCTDCLYRCGTSEWTVDHITSIEPKTIKIKCENCGHDYHVIDHDSLNITRKEGG